MRPDRAATIRDSAKLRSVSAVPMRVGLVALASSCLTTEILSQMIPLDVSSIVGKDPCQGHVGQ